MGTIFSRLKKPMVYLGLLVLFVTQCVPEKKVDLTTKVVPLSWIDEDQFVTRVDNSYAIHKSDGTVSPVAFKEIPRTAPRDFGFEITPTGESQIENGKYISVGVEMLPARRPSLLLRQTGMNQRFEQRDYINATTYLNNGEIGFIVFQQAGARKIALPLKNTLNKSPPIMNYDSVSGGFFAFQSACLPTDSPGTCTRSAWWIDRSLQVTSSFLLPSEDPLHTREKLSCFSCGCGCYTQEDVYAVNGTAYFQYSGFPLPTSQRGLYRLVAESDGSTKWKQVISGRIEPPLAFSPSGCKVAYFQVSWLGDSLKTKDICQ